MNNGILDLDGQPLSSFEFSLPFSGNKLFSIKVPGATGTFLKSVDGANVFYSGRFNDLDSWTSLTSGLDTSAYNGILVEVKIKVETDEATTPKQQKTTLFLQPT